MIKIAFDDWWKGFNYKENFITKALSGEIEFEITDVIEEADILFCSIEKINCFKYKCPRILFTGENYSPNFNFYDYAIGFDQMSFGDRYFRYPLYMVYYDEGRIVFEEKTLGDENKRGFCSFVVSNYSAEKYREKLFDSLNKYKTVASGGRYKNNINLPEGVKDKRAFLKKYKFNIACENISHPGYCTEKILEAFASNTVPIYWGDPGVEEYFNPKAFINCNNYKSIEDVIDYIKEIDTDDNKYMKMLSEPMIINPEYELEMMNDKFREWLIRVVSQDKEHAYRRCFSGYSHRMEEEYIAKLKMESKLRNKSKKDIIKTVLGLKK